MNSIYLIHHEYDLPNGSVLPVKLIHEGNDRYERLEELKQVLVNRKDELDIDYHTIQLITTDMQNAVEEQFT